MNHTTILKKITLLIAPLLLFFTLLTPYCLVNRAYIVEWLGCGCPKAEIDEFGQVVSVAGDFNANDFTALFWLFIAICVTVISVFLSKRIPKEKMWLRVLYVVCMFAVSLLIAHHFSHMMMWN